MRTAPEVSPPPIAAFDRVADCYDESFSEIGRAQRQSVWQEMDRVFRSGHRILEINCGSGIDAYYMARRGIRVEACDVSPKMIALARDRLSRYPDLPAQFHRLSSERLDELPDREAFDGVLSNFSGLDCVDDLSRVVGELARLVRPGGHAVVCVFGAQCLWEVLWYVRRRQVSKAFRRFCRSGVVAHLPGASVTVYYRTVRTLRRVFDPQFRLERWRGVGVLVPPSYAGAVPVGYPRSFALLARMDPWLGRCPGIRALADHVVLTLRREAGR